MLQPGTLINQRYQIVGQVGKGGTGEVYEAIDTRLRHRVALKQMLIAILLGLLRGVEALAG